MFGMGKKIDSEEITKEMESGQAVLVDVRGDDEWQGGHAKGALHIPVDRILGGQLPTNDTKIKVYLYCASGGRAGMAASALQAKGFTTENLGGLSAWRSAGGSIE